MLQILLAALVENQVVNILIALVIILVVGGIAGYAINRQVISAEAKGWLYAVVGLILILLFLFLIGII